MIPIRKNINVIDENGNRYESTYPKRANGLVKNGRARFVDENTICLACPPNIILEDKNMKDKNNQHIINEKDATNSINQTTQILEDDTISMAYITSRLDMIINNDEHIKDSIQGIINLKINDSLNGGQGDAERAIAIKGAVTAREATNQKIIEFLNKMYDNKMAEGKPINSESSKYALAETLLSNPGLDTDMLPDILASISNL